MLEGNNYNPLITSSNSDKYSEGRKIVGLTIVSIVFIIYFPICCYGVYQYNKHRQWIVMQKRYQWITMYILINTIFSLILLSIVLLGYAGYFDLQKQSKWVNYFLFYPLVVLAINIGWKMSWRLWMYYFDINWTNSIANNEWKQLIDESSPKNDWFLTHKHKYGKWTSFTYPYLLIVLVDCFLITIWDYVLPTKEQNLIKWICTFVTMCVISLFPVSIIIYLRLKTPEFDDNFAIRDETRNVLLTVLIGLIAVIILGIVSALLGGNHDAIFLLDILQMSVFFIWASIYTLITYFTTLWVIHKNKEYLPIDNDEEVIGNDFVESLEMNMATHNHMSSMSKSKSRNSSKGNAKSVIPLTLNRVMTEDDQFNVFMGHLSQEFSVEIMLSLIEMDQFQRSLLKYYCVKYKLDYNKQSHVSVSGGDGGGGGGGVSNIEWKLQLDSQEFAPSVPLSSLVHGNVISKSPRYQETMILFRAKSEEIQELIEFKIRAYALFQKYIIENSVYEINIASRTRKKVKSICYDFETFVMAGNFDDIDAELLDLFKLFKQSIQEMFSLLGFSFRRFQENLGLFE